MSSISKSYESSWW